MNSKDDKIIKTRKNRLYNLQRIEEAKKILENTKFDA